MILLFFFFLISLFIISICRKKHLSIAYTFIVISLSVISYFYVPTESADLYRHFETIEFYGEMGLSWVLENECHLNPLTSLLLYLFSYLHDPHLYTSFVVIVTYGFTMLLLYRISKYYSLNKRIITLLYTFLICNWNYLLVASNCRIFMLYAIVAFFFYMEFIEDKMHKTALVIYIAAIFFHYGILLVLIPRFLLYLYKPKNKILYAIIPIVLLYIAYNGVSSYGSIFVDSVSDRVTQYQDYKVFGLWQFLNSFICVLICCFFTFTKRIYLSDLKRFRLLFWLIIIPIVLQLSNFQVIYRESNIVASLSVVLFSHILSKTSAPSMQLVVTMQSILSVVYSFMYVYPHMDFIFY